MNSIRWLVLGLLAASPLAIARTSASGQVINEVLGSHTGTDNTEFVELFGEPGTALEGLSLIIVESDSGDLNGTVDRRFDFKACHFIGENGFFLIGVADGLASNYEVTPDVAIAANFVENSSYTIALVETNSIPDAGAKVTGGEVVIDAVGVTDGGAEDAFFFGAPVIGPDGSFLPAGVRRKADGVDTDTADDFDLADFFLGDANTPTAGGHDGCAPLTIPEIQGAGHVSPFVGESRVTSGIVTAVAFSGFYVQDPEGDGDDATSDGLFVFNGSSDKPSVGTLVMLEGEVSEFIPGGAGTGNLSVTQMAFPIVTVMEEGQPLPEPMIIGTSGRIPPNEVVISESELPVNLQNATEDAANPFNPEVDGIDFYESLEGMLVLVEEPVCVSALRSFGRFSSEVFTLPNCGDNIFPADARTKRGGISLQPDLDNRGDQNPERVQIQFDASETGFGTLYPGFTSPMNVGDKLSSVLGVVGYNFGNFEVNAIEVVDVDSANLKQETSKLKPRRTGLTVASYNVLNLSPDAQDDAQRMEVAMQIVDRLRSPDIIALQEIQDNSGNINDGTVDADQTLEALVDAIEIAGGPNYRFFDVAPVDGTQGGIPGGNIRNAFLYNPKRVKLLGYKALTEVVLDKAGVSNPAAFNGSRIPLLANFRFCRRRITIINNHLTSRFGSTPVFGGVQPFVQAGEEDREQQVMALNEYVNRQVRRSPSTRMIVLGDLNTFEFTDDLQKILPARIKSGGSRKKSNVLRNLLPKMKDDNKYTFIFDGNSQNLDHMFVTRNLYGSAKFDIVHTNVDFYRPDDDADVDGDGNPDGEQVGSDHEPLLARFDFGWWCFFF